MSARCIGLIANHSKSGADKLVREIADECARRSLTLVVDQDTTAGIAGQSAAAAPRDMVRSCEVLLVLGGDGTMLQVVHDLDDEYRPLLGINLGTLGALTCVSAASWREAIESVAAGTYRLSERTLLEVEIIRDQRPLGRHVALNDAVISRGEHSRLIKLDVAVDDIMLSEYNADGLIVATPTGSTAYSLSAGGPVLTPDSGVFVVTPICPHVLTMRPVLVSDDARIEIKPASDQLDVFLTLDGQKSVRIVARDLIRITKAPRRLPLAMLPGMSFFGVLRQKLKWSGTAI